MELVSGSWRVYKGRGSGIRGVDGIAMRGTEGMAVLMNGKSVADGDEGFQLIESVVSE